MKMEKLNVLIVDDHPFIANHYKSAFLEVAEENKELEFRFDIATDSESARAKIKEYNRNNKPDIVLLDISIPPTEDGKILSGEDLGKCIKKDFPKTKIIVSTTLIDNFRLNNIFKNVDPDGFLVKSDIETEEIVAAIASVIKGTPYYSESIINLMRKHMSGDYILDKKDRQLLHELSKGTKMKDLPEILYLSMTAIERRKRKLKEIFGIKSQDDKELLLMAEEKGFI